MGIWGFDELGDGVTLRGTVRGEHRLAGDGDWCFDVEPDKGFEKLLTNPNGFVNGNAMIECEVEPRDDLGALDAEDPDTVEKFFGGLTDRRVTVVGTWVRDRSHFHDANGVFHNVGLFEDGDRGKTEIHPITSLLVEDPQPNPQTRRVQFFVFSDDSANFPAHVPHSDENRIGKFDLPIAPGSTFEVVDELDLARSRSFKIVESGGQFVLRGRVESGTPSEGKGFYHATIDIIQSPFVYAGLFSPGNGGQAFVAGLTFEELVQHWLDHGKLSPPRDLVDVETYVDGGQRKWAGLFSPGAGGQALVAGVSFEDLVEHWLDHGKLSPPRDLVDFSAYLPVTTTE